MTQKKKQIKIAEACGWMRAYLEYEDEGCGEWLWRKGKLNLKWPPDYFNDLNACHEMEKTIPDDDTPSGTWGYIGHLVDLTGAESLDAYREAFVLAHATAAQRAEAFGLTMNLWKEGE